MAWRTEPVAGEPVARRTIVYRPSLLWIAYLVIGVIVAASNNYLEGVGNVEQAAEAALAILLWPLVLLDVSMRI
jgi:hypothetical protein